MIRLELTDQDISDIAEALDDPATSEKNKTKLLVIRMHRSLHFQEFQLIPVQTGADCRPSFSSAR